MRYGRWFLSPWFLLRTTGFPQELMHGISFETTTEHLERPGDWDETKAAFEEEVREKAGCLRAIAASPRFREAVFLSNPASFPHLQRWFDGEVTRPSKDRIGALSTALYLQRLCMKNDTASFFGPTYWGTLNPDSPVPVDLAVDEETGVVRHAFFTHWAVEALANWASGFPQAENLMRPRRVPTMRLQTGSIQGVCPALPRWLPRTGPVALPEGAEKIWTLVDGVRTQAAIVAEAGRCWGLTRDTVLAGLQALSEAGLIHASIEIPVGIYAPMDYLEQELAKGGPSEPLAAVLRLQSLRRSFEQAACLQERIDALNQINAVFEEATGVPSTRGEGHIYADRSILYEEAVCNYKRFQLGGMLLDDLEVLSEILDLLWVITERDQHLSAAVMTDWFTRRFPGRARVSFLEYAEAYVADIAELEAGLAEAEADLNELVRSVYYDLVPAGWKEGVVKRTRKDVAELTRQLGGAGRGGVIANPDLLIAAADLAALNAGAYKLVLGELHCNLDALTFSSVATFHPDQQALSDFVGTRYKEAVPPSELVSDIIRLHTRKTCAQLPFAGPDVEAQGRSLKPPEQVLQLADLEVHLGTESLRLYAPRWDAYLCLTTMRAPIGGGERRSPLRPFSFPRRDVVLPLPVGVTEVPRIEIGRIVLQRRLWRLRYQDWCCEAAESQAGWSFELFVRMREMRIQLGLPLRVFSKVDGERKGTYLDFSNYFMVHAFYKLWREHRGYATFTEMCPDLDENWLEGKAGHYSCELRMGFYRDAEQAD